MATIISFAITLPCSPTVVVTNERPSASPSARSVMATHRFQRGKSTLAPVRAWLKRKRSSTNFFPSASAAASMARQRK